MSILPVGYTWNKEDLPATRYGGVSSIVNTEVNGERGLIWTAVWQRMKNDNLTVSHKFKLIAEQGFVADRPHAHF